MNGMVSIKLKFRPSAVKGKVGSLYYQVIYKRVVRQILTEYKIFANEWDSDNESLILSTADMMRYNHLSATQQKIEWDNRRFQHIIRRLSSAIVFFSPANLSTFAVPKRRNGNDR